MNIDFHVHGLLSKKSDFNERLLLEGIENAKENGLDGFILCEHFNAKNITEIYDYLYNNYNYIGDRYEVNGFSVFIGMEVDIKGGGHIIISGNRDNILEVRNVLNKYMLKPNFIEFKELLELGEKYNCLMVGSHPYRESHKLYLHPKELLCKLHALDLNATDIFSKGLDTTKIEIEGLCKEINIPYVTGSDSHYPIQLGSVKTKFKGEFYFVEDIIEAIKSRDFKTEVSKSINLKVFSAKITKAYIKESLKNNEICKSLDD